MTAVTLWCRRLLPVMFVVLAACRTSSGPPAEQVKKAAEALFERAARGERVAGIQFTAEGPDAPRLIASDIRARRKVSTDRFEYEVRLTYLNRIRQMEWGNVTLTFEEKGGRWVPQ
jgi:hypothetical protein